MAKAESIAPFPADIDRDSFGHWLSGFTDGEGHFSLFMATKKGVSFGQPTTAFRIGLRDDDSEILKMIQSFWQCGTLFTRTNAWPDKHYSRRRRPQTIFQVGSTMDLMETIVPHFIRYPLMAKKARDFVIWRQGVELSALVYSQSMRNRQHTKWNREQREQYRLLIKAIREQRSYSSDIVSVSQVDTTNQELPLFD